MPSKIYRFALDKELAAQLEADAKEAALTLQDYIRWRIFPDAPVNIFSPQEAVRRAREKYQKGDTFTLPDLYGEDWALSKGIAGAFGKYFNEYIAEHFPDTFSCDRSGRNVRYTLLE